MEILNKKIFTYYSLLITHYSRRRRAGFTLIEVILSMAIFSLIFYLASASFVNIQKSRLLNDNLWQIVSILRQNQSKSTSGEAIAGSHLRFGVLFSENYYHEFATLTDFDNREEIYDMVTNLPSSLHFIDFNLPDTCLSANNCILFSPIVGTPSASASISLEDQINGARKIISINEQGKVSF